MHSTIRYLKVYENNVEVFVIFSRYFSCIILNAKIGSVVDLPGMNPNWFLCNIGYTNSISLGGCPLREKSSMCMMCLKYRIIQLFVIKNPWKYLLTYFLFRGAAPCPAWALTAPLRPQLVCSPPSVVPTLRISLALHLPCRHLAINLV